MKIDLHTVGPHKRLAIPQHRVERSRQLDAALLAKECDGVVEVAGCEREIDIARVPTIGSDVVKFRGGQSLQHAGLDADGGESGKRFCSSVAKTQLASRHLPLTRAQLLAPCREHIVGGERARNAVTVEKRGD